MLTEAALNERKWGRYPALRRMLEQRGVAQSFYGATSVSDNVFDQLNRLLEVALTVSGNAPDIAQAVQSPTDEVVEDLRTLGDDLRAAVWFIKKTAEDIRNIEENLRARKCTPEGVGSD